MEQTLLILSLATIINLFLSLLNLRILISRGEIKVEKKEQPKLRPVKPKQCVDTVEDLNSIYGFENLSIYVLDEKKAYIYKDQNWKKL